MFRIKKCRSWWKLQTVLIQLLGRDCNPLENGLERVMTEGIEGGVQQGLATDNDLRWRFHIADVLTVIIAAEFSPTFVWTWICTIRNSSTLMSINLSSAWIPSSLYSPCPCFGLRLHLMISWSCKDVFGTSCSCCMKSFIICTTCEWHYF